MDSTLSLNLVSIQDAVMDGGVSVITPSSRRNVGTVDTGVASLLR